MTQSCVQGAGRVTPGGNGALVAWQREPVSDVSGYSFGALPDGPLLSPAGPAANEVIRQIAVSLGTLETLSRAINLTATGNVEAVEIAMGELRSPAGVVLPSRAVEVFRQDRFRSPARKGRPESPAECAFWLLPNGRLHLRRGETKTVWLRFQSNGVEPGRYDGKLSLRWASGEASLPVTVTILRASLAQRPEITLGLYENYWLAPFPAKYPNSVEGEGKSVTDLRRAIVILEDVIKHGCRDAGGAGIDPKRVRVCDSGKSLDNYFVMRGATPEQPFAPNGIVPALDFSDYDAQVDAAIAHGCHRAIIRHGRAALLQRDSNYVSRMTGEEFGSPRWNQVFMGLWAQFREYLGGRGFTEFVFKYGDELGPEETRRQWTPVAQLVKAAGWQPAANWTGASVSPDLLNQVSNLCQYWEINAQYADQFQAWRAAGVIRIGAASRVTCYGSWGYFKAPHVFARLRMWEAWARDLDGLDLYTWTRQVLWDGESVIPSVAPVK